MGSSRVCFAMAMVILWMMIGVEGQNITATEQQGLRLGFYAKTCPTAESVVAGSMGFSMIQDIGSAAGILRMHFHDCFVRGCDGSILIDSTNNPTNVTVEKDAPSNRNLRGFEVIDHAKTVLEQVCPGVVSCADILAFAARDSVVLSGGQRYEVPSGRRDGRISLASEAVENLPPPSFNLGDLNRLFQSKGLNETEMIALSGAHSIGRSHCGSFEKRLYSFNETHPQDPSLESLYAASLRAQCPSVATVAAAGGNSADASSAAAFVPMDPRSPNTLDTSYYTNIVVKQTLFTSDQTLASGDSALKTVSDYAVHPDRWNRDFSAAMIKMGQIGVLTGNDGEVRRNCRVVNN